MKKRPYQKPEIKEVMLTPEDAVLANCKRTTGGNKSAGRCRDSSKCTASTAGS